MVDSISRVCDSQISLPENPQKNGIVSKKRAYIQVDYEKRLELLEQIQKDHSTIKAASEKLKINYSTAKNIIKLYRKESRIHKLPKRGGLGIRHIGDSFKISPENLLCSDLLPKNVPENKEIESLFRFNYKTTSLSGRIAEAKIGDQCVTDSAFKRKMKKIDIPLDQQSHKSSGQDSTYALSSSISFDFMPYYEHIKSQYD